MTREQRSSIFPKGSTEGIMYARLEALQEKRLNRLEREAAASGVIPDSYPADRRNDDRGEFVPAASHTTRKGE